MVASKLQVSIYGYYIIFVLFCFVLFCFVVCYLSFSPSHQHGIVTNVIPFAEASNCLTFMRIKIKLNKIIIKIMIIKNNSNGGMVGWWDGGMAGWWDGGMVGGGTVGRWNGVMV
jgi:hypothetical protein